MKIINTIIDNLWKKALKEQKKMTFLKNEVTIMSSRYVAKSGEVQTLLSELAAAKTKAHAVTIEKEQLEAALTEKHEEVREVTRAADDLTDRLTEKDKEIEQLKADREASHKDWETLRGKYDEANKEIVTLRAKLNQFVGANKMVEPAPEPPADKWAKFKPEIYDNKNVHECSTA